MTNRADMVLMRVSDKDRFAPLPLIFKQRRIRRYQINARRGVVTKRHADIEVVALVAAEARGAGVARRVAAERRVDLGPRCADARAAGHLHLPQPRQ